MISSLICFSVFYFILIVHISNGNIILRYDFPVVTGELYKGAIRKYKSFFKLNIRQDSPS